jgi:hypothetical protein
MNQVEHKNYEMPPQEGFTVATRVPPCPRARVRNSFGMHVGTAETAP